MLVMEVRSTVATSPAQYGVIMRSRWPTNGSFVSNNNIFTILFFNTYYHKQINKISIAAFNETSRQSLDPVYAHTPIRNVKNRELRTFNPKLRTSPQAKSMTACHHWMLCREQTQTKGITWTTGGLNLWRHMASPGCVSDAWPLGLWA